MCYIAIIFAIFSFSVSEELHHSTYKNLSLLVGIEVEVVAIVLEVVVLVSGTGRFLDYMSPVKRICVFEHSVMTYFNCACPAIQRGQGSGFLSEGSSRLAAYMSEQRRFWRDCADAQARLNLRCSHRL